MKITCSNLIPHVEQLEGFLQNNLSCSNVEISDGHTGNGKTFYNRKIYNEDVTDKLQFLEDKKLNVNLIKESPENNLTYLSRN